MLNLANFGKALKTLYSADKVVNMTQKSHPFMAQLPRNKKFTGKNKQIDLIYGKPQGRSADFAKAQANKGNSKVEGFLVTRSKDYGLISIDNETIKASQDDAGAFLQARKVEIDGIFTEMADTGSIDLFGTGSGVRGQVSATQDVTSSTLVLALDSDIMKLELGQKLVFSSTNGGGVVKNGAGYVVTINRRAGTCQLAAAADGNPAALNTLCATIAQNDYIFVDGDYDAKLKGLQAWLPYGGPAGGDNFFGVDRTKDPDRLAGIWDDYSALSVQEAIIKMVMLMNRFGAKTDKVWISDTKMEQLILELGSRVMFVDMQITPTIGFRGVRVQTPKGVVDVYSDTDCPLHSAFPLQTDTWKLETLGEFPEILNMDTLEALREATADAIEIRIGYYGQLTCNAPGYNGHFKI